MLYDVAFSHHSYGETSGRIRGDERPYTRIAVRWAHIAVQTISVSATPQAPAVAASLVDTLALVDEQTCAACTPVCGERFSHLTMTTTAKGYAKQWVCADREACLARQTAGAGERVRKAARR